MVYFSRLGYVKKLACEAADETGAEQEKYDSVTVCAPIWDFSLAAPVR